MCVVCLHPHNGNAAFVDQVPVMSDAVVGMMKYQREKVYNCSGMAANDVHEMDPFGGMNLDADGMDFNDMVHLEGETLVDEPAGDNTDRVFGEPGQSDFEGEDMVNMDTPESGGDGAAGDAGLAS